MMMMMDELTLTWHIVLRLQGHVTVKKESRIVDALVDCTSRDSGQLYEREKSSVFSLPRKTGSDDEARTDSGRLFQTDVAAAGKAWSPMVARRVRGPTSEVAGVKAELDCATL